MAAVVRVLRVLVWFALWALVLRALGSAVGVWAAGSLGVASTVLVAVVLPAALFVLGPTWLAWRLSLPRSLRAAACWLSPLVSARDLRSVEVFCEVAAGRPFPPPERVPADAWTALAAALQALRLGQPARADQIVDALGCLPAGGRFPWLARVHGVEALVLAAVGRGDWETAARHAQLGRGRLVALLSLLAAVRAGAVVPGRTLWLRWLLAPGRRHTFRLVRALRVRQRLNLRVTPAPAPVALDDDQGRALDPRLRHLWLLRAAAGRGVTMPEVFALADAWQAQLDAPATARLSARALELDVREPAAEVARLREQVLDELAEMAVEASGQVPPVEEGTLGGALAGRVRARLLAVVEAALLPLDPARLPPALHPLEAWERWLAVRAALERVEQQAGPLAVTTLWHSGVRNAVWNATCALFDRHRTRAAWVAHAMFAWLADHAECQGDLSTTLINRENARVAHQLAAGA